MFEASTLAYFAPSSAAKTKCFFKSSAPVRDCAGIRQDGFKLFAPKQRDVGHADQRRPKTQLLCSAKQSFEPFRNFFGSQHRKESVSVERRRIDVSQQHFSQSSHVEMVPGNFVDLTFCRPLRRPNLLGLTLLWEPQGSRLQATIPYYLSQLASFPHTEKNVVRQNCKLTKWSSAVVLIVKLLFI